MTEKNMESVMHEDRVFAPSDEFRSRAHINSMEEYQAMHQRSLEDPEGFWAEAAESVHWFKKWNQVLDDSDAPFFRWFTSGKRSTQCA